MRRTLLAVALLGLAAPAAAGDYRTVQLATGETILVPAEYRTVGLMGGGTVDVPTDLLADQPSWTAGYTPAVDGRGHLWLWARLADESICWVQPKAWSDRVMGEVNYGVDLGQSTQEPGTIVTNDPELGQRIGSTLGTSTGTGADPGDCGPRFQPSLLNVNTDGLVVGGALVAAALLVGLGLRRRDP